VTSTVFIAVLLAAFLHAAWNALIKSREDKLLATLAVVVGFVPVSVLAIVVFPVPHGPAWPYIIVGGIVHAGYLKLLVQAYHHGDLSHVYPIARGTAPLLVTVASLGLLKADLTLGQVIGIVCIAAGILSLSLARPAGQNSAVATALALLVGGFIALYSIVDGLGARLSGSPFAYFAWESLITAAIFCVIAKYRRPDVFQLAWRGPRWTPLIGGTASYIAYAIVVWAFTLAPIALVAALRETSMVFALIIGVAILREPLNIGKLVATFLAICGAAIVKLAR